MGMNNRMIAWVLGITLLCGPSVADTVFLVDKQGRETAIATVTPMVDGSYDLDVDHGRFTDHFLSMKEMKCLEGPELWCHLPYPYHRPETMVGDDFRWLEHDLLFMFKRPGEFGANFWNGIYYKMHRDGDTIRGEAMAVDLNKLAAPPDDQSVPPLSEDDLDEIDRDSRWLPDLVIK